LSDLAIPLRLIERAMKALNRHVERVFNPDAKKHHWGKRKPKRED